MIRRTVFRTIAFKLTLSLAILFGTVSAAGMVSIYLGVARHLNNMVDADLRSDLQQHFEEMATYHYDAETLQRKYVKESKEDGPDTMFIRVISATNDVLASSDMETWKNAADAVHPEVGDTTLATIERAGNRKARIITGPIGDGRFLQIGIMLDKNVEFLTYFRYVVAVVLLGMLCIGASGSAVNYFAVKKEVVVKQKLETRLVQAQKMEAIGTLAGGIAHDFNNILAAIMGYAQLASMKLASDCKAHGDLQEVLKASDRAKELVKQILTFARQSEQKKKPVQISLVAKEVLKLLRASFPTTIEMRQSIDSHASAMADPTQIHQILMNLCTNAKLAMPDGGQLGVSLVEVQLDEEFASRHTGVHPGAHLQLTVSDTGVGMSREVVQRIFDPFYTTRQSGDGTGMGLSVVHGIVKDSGGLITVYSEPGIGSTFNVFLPTVKTPGATTEEATTSLPTGTERLLVVDDEEVLADMAKSMLQHLGYAVTVMTDSREALEAFRRDPDAFDLVISDVTMPRMTGDVLVRRMMDVQEGIPIILCSGYSERMDAAAAEAIGVEGFLMKPMLMTTLAHMVREVLDREHASHRSHAAELEAA